MTIFLFLLQSTHPIDSNKKKEFYSVPEYNLISDFLNCEYWEDKVKGMGIAHDNIFHKQTGADYYEAKCEEETSVNLLSLTIEDQFRLLEYIKCFVANSRRDIEACALPIELACFWRRLGNNSITQSKFFY